VSEPIEPRPIGDEEFAAVVRLPAPKRYEHMIKQVAASDQLWVLADERGIVSVADDSGHDAMPVWPHRRYAEAWRERSPEESPETIALDVWLEEVTPQLERDGQFVAVFPTPEGAGMLVEPARFRDDLQAYLDEWY
jgi:hypothetical protein